MSGKQLLQGLCRRLYRGKSVARAAHLAMQRNSTALCLFAFNADIALIAFCSLAFCQRCNEPCNAFSFRISNAGCFRRHTDQTNVTPAASCKPLERFALLACWLSPALLFFLDSNQTYRALLSIRHGDGQRSAWQPESMRLRARAPRSDAADLKIRTAFCHLHNSHVVR